MLCNVVRGRRRCFAKAESRPATGRGTPGCNGSFLAELTATLPHSPTVRVTRGDVQELLALTDLKRLLKRYGQIELTRFERSLLPVCGLGPEAVQLVNELAQNPRPVFIQGERGTGKEWVARIIHRLSHLSGPFLVMRPGEEPVLDTEQPGMLYLERLHQHPQERSDSLSISHAQKGGVSQRELIGADPRTAYT